MVEGFRFAYDGFDPDAEGLREALTSTAAPLSTVQRLFP
jgi:hypothetical protein